MRTLPALLASLALVAATPAYADTLQDALEAYTLYQNDVGALAELDVSSAGAIDGALARVQRHDPARVARGFMAHGALTAAQSPAFVAGVERDVRGDGREQVLAQLRSDTAWARRETRGAPQAIDLVLAAAVADGARARDAGNRYDRLSRIARARWITSTEENRVVLTSGAPRGREQSTHADVANRMLTAAALVAAGAERSERARISALLDEPQTRYCLSMQRQQLRQCLSISTSANERAYCLGQHGLSGPGACFSAMAR
jgi:hypothetical protein